MKLDPALRLRRGEKKKDQCSRMDTSVKKTQIENYFEKKVDENVVIVTDGSTFDFSVEYENVAVFSVGCKKLKRSIHAYQKKNKLPLECDNCFKEYQRLKRCSGCKSAWYCSKRCQVEHWKIHKEVCRS